MIEHKNKIIINYIKMDLYRAFYSWKFIIGVLGVSLTMMMGAVLDGIELDKNVLQIFILVVYGMPFMLTMIFSSFPYSGCFCEDYEEKYIRLEVIRGRLSQYTLAKVIAIFTSTIAAMTFGIIIFICILHFFVPWVNVRDSFYSNALLNGGIRGILKNGHFLIYYSLLGIKLGIMVGILALISSYLSLYISNKLLILSMPAISYYFIDYFIKMIFGRSAYTFNSIFSVSRGLLQNNVLSIFLVASIGVVNLILGYVAIYGKLERKMKDE